MALTAGMAGGEAATAGGAAGGFVTTVMVGGTGEQVDTYIR